MSKIAFTIILILSSSFAQAQTSGVTSPFMHMYNQQRAASLKQMEVMQKNQATLMKGQRNQSILMLLGGMCSSFFGGGQNPKKIKTIASEIEDQAYDQLEDSEPSYDPNWDQGQAREFGSAANAVLAPECSNYINSEGKLGPWGTYALSVIRTHPDSFGENVPSDTNLWCPNYPSMTVAQREMVWVSNLMSSASPESSCNPAAKGRGPDGIALGLHQVWAKMAPDSCKYATDLLKPNQNIRCAVDQLAMELKNRDPLLAPKGKTYWGTFRANPHPIDAKAAKETRAMMKKFPLCNGPLPKTATASAPATS